MSYDKNIYEARFWFCDPLPDYINVWPFKTNRMKGTGVYHSIQAQPSGITLRQIIAGNWTICMYDRSYEIKPGDIFYAIPSEKIEFIQAEESSDWEWLEVQFNGPGAIDFPKQFGLNRKRAAATPKNPEIVNQTICLMHELMADDNRVVSRQLELLFRLVAAVGEEPRPHSDASHDAPRALVAAVIDYIDSTHKLDCNVSQLAERFNIDRTTLCRAFKRFAGMPPHQFIDNQRFMRSQELLVSTSMSIAKIASGTGFTDVKYFTSWFKSKTGLPPGQWREGRGQ